MLGLLADFAVDTVGGFLAELLFVGLIRPFQRRRPQVKSKFGLI
jgi:hypothetical protein